MNSSETPPSLPPQTPATLNSGGKNSTGVVVLIVVGLGIFLVFILAILAGLLLPALAKAKSKAQEIKCINNLKNAGLAVRIYASDNQGKWPSGWLQVTNELGIPRILICPGDPKHTPASTWEDFNETRSSYPYLGKGGDDGQTNRVIAICPIHGHVALADGSVQRGMRGRTIGVIERDGGTYLDANQSRSGQPGSRQ